MFGIQNLASFLLASTLVIVLPGPATFFVLGQARHAAADAGRAALGIVAGDVILIGLSGLGFSALVARWPLLLTAIKLGGAVYIAWLGVGLLKSRSAATGSESATQAPCVGRSLLQGLLITLTNPKPILFFAAFFPMFIGSGTAMPARSFYTLGACFEALNLAYFAAIIAAMVHDRRARWFARFLDGGFQTASGMGLLCCAGLILASAWR
jgi:leucine efflux protein